jgi:AmmeMemoRadiSam system protein B
MKKEYKLRFPVVNGLFYPDDGEELKQEIDIYIEKVDKNALHRSILEQTGARDISSLQPVALIAPHAGYIFSASVQAHAYALLGDLDIDTVVIIGPAHQVSFEGVSVSRDDAYQTPLGEVEVDMEFARQLLSKGHIFKIHEDADLEEHAIEVQVPFVQALLPEAKIVPILVGEQNKQNALLLKDALLSVIEDSGRKTIIIASSDLSHYHSHVDAEALDNVLIEQIRNMDPDGLYVEIQDGSTEACGFCGILTCMYMAQELGIGKSAILSYTDSGEVSGDRRKVVGYLAAALY